MKHTRQPCPLDLRGPRQPERRAKGQLGTTRLGFECWPLARTALTEGPVCGCLRGFTYFFSDHSASQLLLISPGCRGAQV